MINEKMYALGSKRSIIREIFEYSKIRSAQIGAENVYDFSLGNPSVEPPVEIKQAITSLIEKENAMLLHGYTSAQGDLSVRKTVANSINSRFNLSLTENNIYMTCGAAASLTISLKAVVNPGEEVVVFAACSNKSRMLVPPPPISILP